MAKRKFTTEEVRQWQEDHNQTIFYINKNDSNLIVKRRSGGVTLNLTHPGAWVVIVILIGVIVTIIFHKPIFG